MTTDRLAAYGALFIAAGASLHHAPLGLVVLGVIMVAAAMLRAYDSGRNG